MVIGPGYVALLTPVRAVAPVRASRRAVAGHLPPDSMASGLHALLALARSLSGE